jgi:hypothetical protein
MGRAITAAHRVRPARREDIVPLVEMLDREFVPVAPDGARFDPARSVAALDSLPRIYLGVRGDEIVGCLGLRHGALWWTGTPYVCDQPFFVAERARASTLARDLLAAGERYAAGLGWPFIITVSSGTDLERKAAWLQRKGFRALGGMYARGL